MKYACIAFRMGEAYDEMPDPVRLLGAEQSRHPRPPRLVALTVSCSNRFYVETLERFKKRVKELCIYPLNTLYPCDARG